MHVKRFCVSLKHLLLCFPAGAWARGRGRAPCSSGGFGWDCGHCPCHPDPAGSRRAQPRWAVSEHSCLLHSSQPAAASCRTATVPAVTAAVKSQGSGEGSLIEDTSLSFFLYNEAPFSKASLSAKPPSCQTLWKQRAEAVRSEPFLLTQQVCLCTSKGCNC